MNLFRDCPRCFYDQYTLKVARPRGIMSTLPGGIDRVIKPLADHYAGKLPAFLEGKVYGTLISNREKMKKWGNWRTGMRYFDPANKIELYGALDECAVIDEGEAEPIYVPVDWKTKGGKPKDSGAQYYQLQLDCYNLMLHATGLKIASIGYLVYLYPTVALDDSLAGEEWVVNFPFSVDVYKLDCNIENAKEMCVKAVTCLRGERPSMNYNCEYCMLVEKKKQLEVE